MKLYHYAKTRHPVLLVSRLSVVRTASEIRREELEDRRKGLKFSYLDHISFYFDPLPRDLGRLYEDEGIQHEVWRSGEVLYEHIIDTAGLEFGFDLVETPQDQAYLDRFWDDKLLEPTREADYYRFQQRRNELADSSGYSVGMGYNTAILEKVVSPFLGKTRAAYVDALKTQDKDTLSRLYAPAVPHLFIYPKEGKIVPIAVAKPFRLT